MSIPVHDAAFPLWALRLLCLLRRLARLASAARRDPGRATCRPTPMSALCGERGRDNHQPLVGQRSRDQAKESPRLWTGDSIV